jgi:hypothetical protein
MRKAQAVQGMPAAPQPRQYMTPGMKGYTMSPGGTPEIKAPPSIAGTGQMQGQPETAQPSSPLPSPGQAVREGITFGPQQNQGMPPMATGPLGQQRSRQTEDPNRRRKKMGG